MQQTSHASPTRARALLSMVAAGLLAACGFSPQPQSGTMVCKAQGSACCPEGYVCVGRGLATPGGPADGTCWSKDDLPVEAFTAVHDYTPAVPSDPACVVTDWLPPELATPSNLPDASMPQPDGPPGTGTDAGKDTSGPAPSQLAAPGTLSLGDHMSFLVRQGSVLAWGDNSLGLLGDGTTMDRTRPVALAGLPPGSTGVASGEFHTCAVVNGGVYCWGHNDYWELGIDSVEYSSKVPVMAIEMGSAATAVVVGFHHTCALVNGGVQCWGEGTYGALGDSPAWSAHNLPRRLPDLPTGVTAIAAGEEHTCAVVNGGVRCWGSNGWYQLGDGTSSSRFTPVAVVGLESGVTAISSRHRHTCALVQGRAYCWGDNSSGQLGDGTLSTSSVPVQVQGLPTTVSSIVAGESFTCAIVGAGAVLCWGANGCKQLSTGVTGARSLTPVAIPGLQSGVELLSISACNGCAVVGPGVKCWGLNSDGELGTGTTAYSAVPVDVKF